MIRLTPLSKPYLLSNGRHLYRILYNIEDDYFYYKTVDASNRAGRLLQINKNKSWRFNLFIPKSDKVLISLYNPSLESNV